jgi:hypothetical protein
MMRKGSAGRSGCCVYLSRISAGKKEKRENGIENGKPCVCVAAFEKKKEEEGHISKVVKQHTKIKLLCSTAACLLLHPLKHKVVSVSFHAARWRWVGLFWLF